MPVKQRLELEGLEAPCLNALQAVDSLYTVLALQPKGRICIEPDSISHANKVEAKNRTAAFLKLAATSTNQPDLIISPEYSVPWEALLEAIEQGLMPKEGKLWVLGCESIPLDKLDSIRERLGARAVVIDDDTFPGTQTTQRYRNPLVYVFLTKRSSDQSVRLVLLVQYKTVPSGDPQNTEATGMLPGVCVYEFGTLPNEVRLITLICSDVFEFEQELINKYYEGLLLLHIQLNKSPRHPLYKKYRLELFAPAGNTELLCLNWAANVVSFDKNGGSADEWKNISGSAWYVRSPEVSLLDDAIQENHLHGIYYTWHKSIRAHAFQFHYQQRVFMLQSTKVFHHAIPKPRSIRTGPKALKTFIWAQDQSQWVEPLISSEFADDGFCEQLEKCNLDGNSLADLEDLYRTGQIAVERTMAITAGKFGPDDKWYSPDRLDSMLLCEQEFVRRITVTQDSACEAVKFRDERFALTRAVAELRAIGYQWPSSVEALRKGFKFHWSLQDPGRNVVADDTTLATVVHAGLIGNCDELDRLDQKVRRTLAGPPHAPERLLAIESLKQFYDNHYATSAKRFCIVYVTGAGGTKTHSSGRDTSFTKPGGQFEVDFATPSPAQLIANPNGASK